MLAIVGSSDPSAGVPCRLVLSHVGKLRAISALELTIVGMAQLLRMHKIKCFPKQVPTEYQAPVLFVGRPLRAEAR